jgi:phospholipid transport system substrate-binding protein
VVVADLIGENISMLKTMGSDFTAVVRAGGGNLDALIGAMRKKISEAGAPR